MPEAKFRNKITWMTFLLSIFVIWVHSYNAELFAGGASAALWEDADKIEDFVSAGLGQTAVPGFFLISSYLFFRSYTPAQLRKKWSERVFSVLLPYVVWNTLYYLGYVVSTRLPAVSRLVGKAPAPFSFAEYLETVFHYSYAPIFWYLYQLLFLIALSPLIYYLVKHKVFGLIYMAALVLAVHLRLDTGHPNTDALFYYSAAAYMAVHGRGIAEGAWSGQRAAAGGALFLLAAVCFGRMTAPGADVLWTVGYRLAVPAALWLALPWDALPPARRWMKQSLYLYAAHYVIVRFVNKGAAAVLGRYFGGPVMMAWALAIYFLMPVLVVAISYLSACLLHRWAPGIWRVLSGGRGLD